MTAIGEVKPKVRLLAESANSPQQDSYDFMAAAFTRPTPQQKVFKDRILYYLRR